jgi:hypothetical protein
MVERLMAVALVICLLSKMETKVGKKIRDVYLFFVVVVYVKGNYLELKCDCLCFQFLYF